jgi:hypothetical protein
MAVTELVNLQKINLQPQWFSLGETDYRQCTLTAKAENSTIRIVFNDVVAFRKTEFKEELVYELEEKLVDLGATDWLLAIRKRLEGWSGQLPNPVLLRHLLVNFYEGPSYEFICYTAEFSFEDSADRKRIGHGQIIRV